MENSENISLIDMIDWPAFFTSLITIVSIFVSNYLGRETNKKDHIFQTKDKTYNLFYVPLIKWLSVVNKEALSYYWLVAIKRTSAFGNEPDWLATHLLQHLELTSSTTAYYYNAYAFHSGNAALFYATELNDDGSYNRNYEDKAKLASIFFDKIIIESLKEARVLSKELGYPDIATQLLSSFDKQVKIQSEHSRYLPEEYREEPPVVFEGPPPFV